MEMFTPVSAVVGGTLIGISAVLLMAFNGRIAGVSGIVFGALEKGKPKGLEGPAELNSWRWYFLVGLIIGAGGYLLIAPPSFEPRSNFPLDLLLISGFMVGFGTRMGSGCTSGHGVCGIARLSKRSIVATLTFLLVAMVTVYLVRHVAGLEL